ncbi:MAG: hypothetical protein ACFFDN_15855 [Candidatus Hodarchaeota archaeon]
MPYIFVYVWYPSHKVEEAVKVYLEMLKKFPEDESLGELIIPASVNTGCEGIKSLSVTKVKEGKLEDALTRASNQMAMFMSVEGFEYSIEVWSTIEEAMAVIGKSLP